MIAMHCSSTAAVSRASFKYEMQKDENTDWSVPLFTAHLDINRVMFTMQMEAVAAVPTSNGIGTCFPEHVVPHNHSKCGKRLMDVPLDGADVLEENIGLVETGSLHVQTTFITESNMEDLPQTPTLHCTWW